MQGLKKKIFKLKILLKFIIEFFVVEVNVEVNFPQADDTFSISD